MGEVGLYNANAMAGPTLEDAWVTSPYWSTHHQDAWLLDAYWPAAPTGADICITEEGAKVIATLPPGKTLDWNNMSSPEEHKAVLFYYEKGAELWAEGGEQAEKSPALRIAFPPYHFIYGSTPTCEELENVPACAVCHAPPGCLNASEAVDVKNPMPLSADGLKMLDAAIKMLKEEARKGL